MFSLPIWHLPEKQMRAYLILSGFTLLSFADNCACQDLKVWGNLAMNDSMGNYFPNSICSLWVSLSRFGHSCNVLNLFTIIVFALMICGQRSRCYYGNCWRHHNPCTCKMGNLGVDRVFWWFHRLAAGPISLPLLRLPYSLRRRTEIDQLISLQWPLSG